MRDSGYKSTATAINEFIDNSLQADATRVDVLAIEGETNGKRGAKKPISNIAIIDDGHGMEPGMLRASVLWGGTHRQNDRTGLGRYGFGLPSAAVSISPHFEVYSKSPGGHWHRVVVDLESIASGKFTNKYGQVVAPEPESSEIPPFIEQYLKKQKWSLESGTIVLISSPDRLGVGFRRLSSFEPKMMEQLGLVYRGALRDISMHVNGKRIDCVDPLFLTPSCRYYEAENGIIAEALPSLQFDATGFYGQQGAVRFRFSLMHPKFQEIIQESGKKTNHKGRLGIMKDNQALFIITRAGRQIDLVTRTPDIGKWKSTAVLSTYDRNWAIELDFDPTLDELFGVTVNKQQIVVSDRMWEYLDQQGLPGMIASMRKRLSDTRIDKESNDDKDKGKPRESEAIMVDAEKFRPTAKPISDEKKKIGTKKLIEEAEKRSTKTGKPLEDTVKELVEETSERKYRIETDAHPGAPFYRPELYGSQLRVWVNRRHRFFTDLYNAPNTPARTRTALELLLFVLATSEVHATGDRETFYSRERAEWSKEIDVALELLDRTSPVDDEKSAKDSEKEAAQLSE
jgi:hypothetical protein